MYLASIAARILRGLIPCAFSLMRASHPSRSGPVAPPAGLAPQNFAPPLRHPCLRTADFSGRGRTAPLPGRRIAESHKPPNHAGLGVAERHRSRTYQPLGYNGLPVLKTGGESCKPALHSFAGVVAALQALCRICCSRGGLRLSECLDRTQEVRGSNPLGPMASLWTGLWPSGCHPGKPGIPGGQGFESPLRLCGLAFCPLFYT
jgi:hypothetical protein